MNVFTDQDYNSNDGMMTAIWGPPLWHSLHTISFNYPVEPTKEQQQQYYAYFTSLKWVLPCKYCRDNLEKNLKILPLDSEALKNRYNFSKWLYDLHNLVNTNLGKPKYKTYQEIRDRYENFRSRCLEDTETSSSERKIEKGCVKPLYGKKSKAVVAIVPRDTKTKSLVIHADTILKQN